jgi:hypothetical protein
MVEEYTFKKMTLLPEDKEKFWKQMEEIHNRSWKVLEEVIIPPIPTVKFPEIPLRSLGLGIKEVYYTRERTDVKK